MLASLNEYADISALRSVCQSIVEQIPDRLLHLSRVQLQQPFLIGDANIGIQSLILQQRHILRDDLPHQLVDIANFFLQREGVLISRRNVEQLLQKTLHIERAGQNNRSPLRSCRLAAGYVPIERIRVTDNGSQRRAKVVRQVGHQSFALVLHHLDVLKLGSDLG